MEDVQNHAADVSLPIDRVGVRNLLVPLKLGDRKHGVQHTVARVELGVDLPAEYKGTHMSRFVESLENWNEELGYMSVKRLLEDLKARLQAQKAQAVFRFPYFLRRHAPVSGAGGVQGYECTVIGELASEKPAFSLEVDVPVMTVCPCSKAISDEGAHSQRAEVRIRLRLNGFCWLEEFIEMAEAAGSSPLHPVLKRPDEKAVTESAFAAPRFVEDVVRAVAEKLARHPRVAWYRVEVESFESIHAHNAFAWIEGGTEAASSA